MCCIRLDPDINSMRQEYCCKQVSWFVMVVCNCSILSWIILFRSYIKNYRILRDRYNITRFSLCNSHCCTWKQFWQAVAGGWDEFKNIPDDGVLGDPPFDAWSCKIPLDHNIHARSVYMEKDCDNVSLLADIKTMTSVLPLLPFSILSCLDSVGSDGCGTSCTDLYLSNVCMHQLGVSWGPKIFVLRIQLDWFRPVPYFLAEIQVNRR